MNVSTATIEQVLGRHAPDIGKRIGADPARTEQAIAVALPALLRGLQQEAAPQSGLRRAIEEDHDGSILDDLAGYVNGTANLDSRTTDGQGILDHVLGNRQPEVERALSSRTGLDLSSMAQLLPLLAPVVMGMLGREARASSTADGGLGDLGSILGGLVGGNGNRADGVGGLGDVLGSILGRNQGR